MAGLSPNRTLPATSVRRCLTRLHHSLYATACGFGRHPRLGTTRALIFLGASLLGAVSGQVQPGCYHPNPPPAYTPKRATGVAITSQIARSRFLTLVRRPDPDAQPRCARAVNAAPHRSKHRRRTPTLATSRWMRAGRVTTNPGTPTTDREIPIGGAGPGSASDLDSGAHFLAGIAHRSPG